MPCRAETITPLIRRAILYIPRSFFYLYPIPYTLSVNESSLLVFGRKPGFWKFLPWYLSVFLIAGLVGILSNAYVVFSYAFHFRIYSSLHISMMQAIISFAMGVFAATEFAAIVTIHVFPELLLEVRAVSELEHRCTNFLFKL